MHANKAAIAMLNRNFNDHDLGVKGLMKIINKLGDPDYIVYQREGKNAGHYAAVLNIDNGDAYAVRSIVEERVNQDPILVDFEVLGRLHGISVKK